MKKIPNHHDYYATPEGEIYSTKRKKQLIKLKPYPTRKGYLLIDLDGKATSVHRIIASLFVEGQKEGLQVNHKDGDKTNNSHENLEWVTNLENQRHSWKNGRKAPRGSSNGLSKLVESQVLEIIELIKEGKLTQAEIGDRYNVARSTIGKIKSKANWGYLWN